MFRFNRRAKSSRAQFGIQSVRDGLLVLPGRRYRMVMELSSINFSLKSEDEQDAIIDTYASFLNSLPAPIQILIRVREIDMRDYVNSLQAKRTMETNPVYKEQIREYGDFILSLIKENKILSRKFYAVVPFVGRNTESESMIKEQLSLMSDIVSHGMSRLGVKARVLNSQEIIELFYSYYTPIDAVRQPITPESLRQFTEVVL